MDLGWKRTITYCFFLFMVGFFFIYSVEFAETLPEKKNNNTKKDDDTEVVITTAQLIEEADFNYILNNKKYNTVFDYEKYLKGTSVADCFYEDENSQTVKTTIENLLTNYKSYLESGYYYYYGFPSTMDFVEFFNQGINDLTYYQAKSMDDIYVYYCYVYGYSNYFNEVINVNIFDDIIVKEYYSETLDQYLYMKGYHLLVCKKNGASIVNTSEYTDDEKLKAQELYDKVYNIAKLINEDKENSFTKKDFFTRMADLFSNGNFAAPSIELNEYLQLNETEAASFQEYYELGFSIISEELEITSGKMVSEFENGCREIFSSQYDRLVNEIKIEEETIHDEAIITSYGYHLYVNELSSLEELFPNGKMLSVPNIVHFTLFIEEYNNSSTTDYISPAGLLAGYLEAKDNNNDEDKIEWIKKIIELTEELNVRELEDLTIENCEEKFIEKYLKPYTNYEEVAKTEPFNYEALAHDQSIYLSNSYFYAPIFSSYASSYNFDRIRYIDILESIKDFNFGDREAEVINELEAEIASCESYLSLLEDKAREYKYGLFEKLDKDMYDELMAHYATLNK